MAKLEMLDFHFEFFYNISTGSVRNSMKALNSSAIHWSVEFNLKVLKFGWDEMDFFTSSIHFQRYKLAMEWRNENFDAIDWQISIWFWRSYILNEMEWIHLMNLTKFQCSWLEIDWKFRCAQLDLLNWFWSMVQLFRYCSAILQVKNKKWINRLVITTFVNFNTENVILSNKTWNSHHRTLTISNTLR